MTYRNDHDAALARIESLERDNAQLRDEVAALRGPAASVAEDDEEPRARDGTVPRGVAALAIVTIVAILTLIATTIRDSEPTEHRADGPRVTMPDAPTGGWR